MIKTLSAAVVAALLLGGCSQPAPAPEFTPEPVLPQITTATPDPEPSITVAEEADPTRDLGSGKPGAFCATSRLGKHFTKGGATYTCKGPKPYRWREGS